MAKIKDTDYLSISARIRALETRLLTQARMNRMLEARTPDEAAKTLAECGYRELPALTGSALDALLAEARAELYRDLKGAAPDPALVEVFQLKYDYHNAKVLIKARAVGEQADRLLMEGGRWSAADMRDAFRRDNLRGFTDAFRAAVTQASEVLGAGGDPQRADFILDRACFEEMKAAAQTSGSTFLQGYVRLLIDTANLRAVVRARRMGRDSDFLSQVLIDGGSTAPHALLSGRGGDLAALFRAGPLAEAAALGAARCARGSGSLTAFERACDNALTRYLTQARRVPFGEQALIGYLCARESEFTAIRTILSGRMAGLGADTIRERLRESYV